MPTPERITEDELSRLVFGLAQTFIQRWDCYPIQLADGHYISIHRPLTTSRLQDHLAGKLTLGTYLLTRRNEARFIVLDADDEVRFDRLADAAGRLVSEDTPCYLERSRRGGHLWFFFAQPVSGAKARTFGKGVMAAHHLDGIELYPKQDQLTSGPGSLIRLPFGIHRRTSKRYGFVTHDRRLLAPTLREQVALLSYPRSVPEMVLSAHQVAAEVPPDPKPVRRSSPGSEALSTRVKEALTVREFVGQYVTLDAKGIGHCPFHDDQHASFAVNAEKNYWSCFAGCGGGSVIDFWSKWRETHGQDSGFASTLKDLAGLLDL